MATVKEFKPNEKQEAFLKVLNEHKNEALTLKQIAELAGMDIKSGSVNTLLTKGMVEHGEDAEIEVTVKRKVKTYVIYDGEESVA